jgi:signal transduction histidine kinase
MRKVNDWIIGRQIVESKEHRKRVLMAAYFILIYIATGSFWLIHGLFDPIGDNTATWIGFGINFLCLFLIHIGWFYFGTFIFLIRANAVTTYYAWLYPETRSDLFFFSAGIAAIAIFGHEKRAFGIFFSLLSLALYLVTANFAPQAGGEFIHFTQQASFTLTYLSLLLLILFFNCITYQYDQIIRKKNLELEEHNATKDKFFSIISHDLKGPLSSLTSFSGLLINHTESLTKAEIQTLARDLDQSVKNLFSLLENLLEWSRSQTGAIEIKWEAFDIMVLLKENRNLLLVQAQNKQIKIRLEGEEKFIVFADPNIISTVIRNLLSNAIKFTPTGGEIVLKIERIESGVRVLINDKGVGISESIIHKLFRLEVKHSTKGTADEPGTGLGLILCKEFVEKNGGTIGVHSEEGKGSSFYFTLPLYK